MKLKTEKIKLMWLKNKKLFSALLFLMFLSFGVILIITVPNKSSANPFDFGVNQGVGLTNPTSCKSQYFEVSCVVVNKETELVSSASCSSGDVSVSTLVNQTFFETVPGLGTKYIKTGKIDGVCPSTNCAYINDFDCGCNSVSYDSACNKDICNQYNDLDCRRLTEIPGNITTELPRVKIVGIDGNDL
ncbi:MAG: hypothetical protein WCX88_00665, partial [Patescibacteria group bacterium]